VETTTAPANTTSVQVIATGGSGGQSGSQASSAKAAGGVGSRVLATFAASGGQTFSGIVGCNGVDGGGFANTATPGGYAPGGGTGRGSIIAGQAGASGGSGGGASAACLGASCTAGSGTPLVVAGGGGGGGSSWARSTGVGTAFSTSDAASVVLTFTISTPVTTTTTSTTSTTTTTTAPCVADKVPFVSVQALVTQQYLDFTNAPPTTAQNAQWVPTISNCSTTADALIVSLLPTDLTTLDDARLVRLYLAYFNRPPDPSGFAYWQRQLDAGKGLINAAKKFAESSEFKTKYGTLSNADFIELVYQNVLGRASDSTGKQFWLTRLDNKTKNRGDVMINFSESSENVNKKRNHVQVFRLYRSMMAKFPSRTAYFALLDPITDNGKTLNDAAKAIRLSPEYDARV
jgi:hypothetical protein